MHLAMGRSVGVGFQTMTVPDAAVPAQTVPLGPDEPDRLGPYTLLGKLGQGGMGTVYLGSTETGRLVAIKVIRPDVADDGEFRSRYRGPPAARHPRVHGTRTDPG
jgi:serine/threonine protein kinase